MKELLIGIHLVGLSMSFMKALTVDLNIARQLLFGVSNRFEYRSLAVLRVGFWLLLISGFGLLLLYWIQSPALLANQKIWAKSLIVLIAGLNGYTIERLVIGRGPGTKLIQPKEPKTLVTIGLLSISWASWIEAFTLGVWKSINFIASFKVLILAYVVLIIAFALGLSIVRHFVNLKRLSRVDILISPTIS